MSALTLPTPWLWASPLEFLHELKQALAEKVSDVLAQRRFDHRLQVLERLVTVWADDIRAAVTSADAENIAAISLDLGQRTLPYYRALIPLALGLLEDLGELDEQVSKTAARAWEKIADDIEELLPHLPPAARRDVRAAALLMEDMLRALRENEMSPEMLNESLARATAAVPDEEARFYGLVQILGVLGREPGLSQTLAEATALMLWRLVRESAPEEVVEEAYLSSEAAEAALERQEKNDISLEDFLRAEAR